MGQLVRSAMRRGSMRRSTSSSSSSVTPPVQADWALTSVRYFFLDYDGGNDGLLGYIDATAGTVFTAGAAAAVAIKTFTRLFQIIPLLGNDRSMVVMVKNRAAGATYLDADGVTESVCDWSGYSGYRLMLRRGSSDLTNSVTDRLLCGFVTALAGPNGDGSFTVLAGATSTVFSVAGTPLTAEPGLIGWRVRFTGNVTAALANVSTNINANTSSQITVGTATAVSAAGDTFFIEHAGTAVSRWIDGAASGDLTSHAGNSSTTITQPALRDVGIRATGQIATTLQWSGAVRQIAGCEQDAAINLTLTRISDCVGATVTPNWADETGTFRNIGFGLRCAATSVWFTRSQTLNVACFAVANNSTQLSSNFIYIHAIRQGAMFTQGSYIGRPVDIVASGEGGVIGSGFGGGLTIGNGAGAATNKTRILGGLGPSQNALNIDGSSVALAGIDFSNAVNAIDVSLQSDGIICSFDNLTGSTNITGTGIAVRSSRGGKFFCGTRAANTLTGTVGDIRCGSSNPAVVIDHADLLLTNVVDNLGNDFIGTAGRLVDQGIEMTAQSARAVGDIIRSDSGANNQARGAQADTLANSPAAGVYVTSPGTGLPGYVVVAGAPLVNFDAAPSNGGLAFLSTTVVGQATTTAPVITGTLQKVVIGRCFRIVGSTARVALELSGVNQNTLEQQPIGATISNAAAAFSATQTWLIAIGTYTADRAFTLEQASTLSDNTVRMVSDFTTAGAFNILLTPNAADSIDGAPAGTALAIPAGSKTTIVVRKMPGGGWKVM